MPNAVRRSIVASLFTAIVALFCVTAHSQKLPIKTYTTADGLATSVIHCAMRDSDGFLWFGGRGGLSRFDGKEFVSFKLEDQAAPLVHTILESRDRKRFWIATDNGLYRAERGGGPTVFPSDEKVNAQTRRLSAKKVSNHSFWALFEETDGRLTGGSDTLYESGDTRGETIEFQKLNLSGGERLRVQYFLQDGQGSLWASTDRVLLRRLPDKRWILYSIPEVYGVGNESGPIASDPNGNIWIPLRTGVYVLRPEAPETFAGLPNDHKVAPRIVEFQIGSNGILELPKASGEMVRLVPDFVTLRSGAGSAVAGGAQSVYGAADGRMWFATSDSIYVIDGTSYNRLRDSSQRPGTGTGIVEDLAGDLWFSTFSGVSKLAIGGMTSYDQSSGLVEPNVHTIQEMPDGRLLVAHGTWMVSQLVDDGFQTSRLNLPANARLGWTAYSTVADRVGSLWVMETYGIYEFRALSDLERQASQQPTRHDDRFPYRAFNDRNGHIWISGNSDPKQAPLRSFDPVTRRWTDYSGLEGYPTRGVASFAEDKLGRVWMGLYGGGAVRLADGKFTRITLEEGLPRGSIFGMLIDRSGRLWIGSSEGGVSRIDDPLAEKLEFKRITEADGLSSNNVRCLTEDVDGNIYAGTVRGVSRIDPATNEVRVLTTADGLSADFVQSAYRDQNGVIWFGTTNGLSRYQPTPQAAPVVRDVFVGSLQVAGIDYRLSEFGQRAVEGLDLSSSENNIRISFTSVGEATRFQYKLEGAPDHDWTAPTYERTLNFANLSPGSYRLLIRTADAAEQEPASVAFTIRPPFWRSWWFGALAFLFVAGSVLALDRYRVSKTRQVGAALARSVESESRFRTLAETASDAIITIEEDSTIVFVNPAVERVFGYTPDELIGHKLTSLMPERMRGGHEAGLARYIRTSNKNIAWNGVTLPGLHKDGSEIPLELSFGEFERDGKRYFTGIARDISERLRAEEELRKAREERMRELQKVRSRIATDLHDDIGSSLTQIAVLSEVARGQASHLHADGIATPLERIKNVSKDLVAVMSDIVWAINPQKDYLSDLVQRMRRFGSDVLSGRGIGFEFNAPGMNESVELGANLRREIFAIFKESINNAVKYSECSRVAANFSVSDDMLLLNVNDDGKGFDAAFVLSDEFKPEMGGNGLVSIRRRVRELGGVCTIRSAPGEGVDITLRVPLHGSQKNGTG